MAAWRQEKNGKRKMFQYGARDVTASGKVEYSEP